ncbi:hypothetical protein PDESU_02408 [Pontiella desulfatans]|uniref:PEP-CTERM protein-sorting domain-containing protein n=1 Tax=Pontiella desulfatans TaxID=2750659 RepID=A0A6C2U2Q3_PONDE|nr:PEP-CTERM sorting domain-containing protein [Pontiella desulfatans]VGO13851.1 hypothetical protein PDESU_02408 [Pontiella desulfatans]
MKKQLAILTTLALTVALAQASVVAHGSTTMLSSSQNDTGSAVINLTAGSATAGGTSVTTFTLGDGTVSEYLFVNAVGENDSTAGSLNVYASAGSSISTPTYPVASLGGNKSNVALTLPDGSTVFAADTGANASDAAGTIQTSGYKSGTVYFIFGTSADFAQVAFGGQLSGFLGSGDSVSDPDHADISEFDFTGTTVGGNGTAIAAFTFDNVTDNYADTLLDYRAINTDLDGSRARFYGVVLDGVAIPEPATLGLVAAFGGGVLFIRRRFMM